MPAIQLKKILRALRVPQAELARVSNVSAATIAQLCNYGKWPSEPLGEQLKTRIENFLAAKKMLPGVIATAFEAVIEMALPSCTLVEPNHNECDPSQEDNDMLLRKQTLSHEAKRKFGIARNPFGDLLSDADMWISQDIRVVREHMFTTAKFGGITGVVGESGAGKSSVRKALAQRIQDENQPIILANPYMLAAEDNDKKGKSLKITHISDSILRAISPLAKARLSAESKFAQLHQALIDTNKSGHRVCVVIEEAHCLSIPALKHLKRLYELEPPNGYGSLISIILIGQPELYVKLSERNPEIRELVQRCEMVTLQPIAIAELESFIDHRMSRIGKSASDIIDQTGITALADRLVNKDGDSQLYPLLVGNFIVAAMNDAAKIGVDVIDADIVKEVA